MSIKKSSFKMFVGVAAVAVIGFSMVGCAATTTQARITKENIGFFPNINVAAKDFTTLGLVFTDTVITHTRSGDKNTASGEIFTYRALLLEAQKLGADAIVNVTIDVKIESRGERTTLFGMFSSSDTEGRRETWYGSALAIKYAEKLSESDIASQGNATNAGGDISGDITNDRRSFFSRGSR